MNRDEATRIILHSTLSAAEKMVMVAHLYGLPDDVHVDVHTVSMSLAELVQLTGFGKPTTRAARRRLIDAGLLIQVRTTERGRLVLRPNFRQLRDSIPKDGDA